MFWQSAFRSDFFPQSETGSDKFKILVLIGQQMGGSGLSFFMHNEDIELNKLSNLKQLYKRCSPENNTHMQTIRPFYYAMFCLTSLFIGILFCTKLFCKVSACLSFCEVTAFVGV